MEDSTAPASSNSSKGRESKKEKKKDKKGKKQEGDSKPQEVKNVSLYELNARASAK